MRNQLYLLIIFLFFLSCKKNTNSEIKQFDKKKDTVRNYYDNGNLKEEFHEIHDTTIVKKYYKNGFLEAEGKLFKDKPTGIWRIYNEVNKSLKVISEFVINEEKSFINQQIHYNNNNNIDYRKSIFYHIINDTLFFYSPLDTLSSKHKKNREIKLYTYDDMGMDKEINFKKRIAIKGYSFPMFIVETVSIDLDSMVDGESFTRLVNRQLLVTNKNICPKND